MIEAYLQQLQQPQPSSHKSQNGKTLIIGGSDLFHAASQWSFRTVSRLVDMTFYSSVAENNELLHDAKLYGSDGVIVPRAEIPHYMAEVDSVLIGPGMRRDMPSRFLPEELENLRSQDLTPDDWEKDTAAVVSVLLQEYPHKQWIIDAGAVQMLQQNWLPEQAILTPHRGEFVRILSNWFGENSKLGKTWERLQIGLDEMAEAYFQGEDSIEPLVLEKNILDGFVSLKEVAQLQDCARTAGYSHWIVKGQADLIWNAERVVAVVGGNAGLTKGGTGDVLAGLVAGFAAKSEPLPSLVVASFLNKKAGHELFQERGVMYNSSDLVEMIPRVWKKVL